MAITGRAVLVALVGVAVAALAGPAGVLGVLAVLVVAVAVDLALAAPVRTLLLGRAGETSVRLGGSVDVRLTLGNPGRRTLRALVRDAWPPSAGAAPTRARVTVPPGERRRLTTTVTPTRRGDRTSARVTVRSVGPLGLAARQGAHSVPWTVRALPPFSSRKHLPSRLARLRELDGRSAVLVRGAGTEFDSLREYVPGDDVRSIDWRATARAADVVVRTWRPERDRHVLIVLDTGRTAAGRVGDAPKLDAALDAALLLAALASRAGDRVDLLAVDREVRASVVGVAQPLAALVHAMAPLEAALVETDHRRMVAAALARAPRRGLVVLLTGLDAAGVHEGLLPALPVLADRHRVVVAAVADPAVEGLAAGRDDSAAVYAAAAAERSRAERRHTAGLLSRLGVTVVDAPPDDLPPALSDTYLALKAAGRL